MRFRRTHTLGSSAAICALVAGALLLLLAGPSQAAFCVHPHDEANDWTLQQSGLAGLCPSAKEDKLICNAWYSQCKKRVGAAFKCLMADFKTQHKYQLAKCKLAADPKACRDNQKVSIAISKGKTKGWKQVGLETCATWKAFCPGNCTPP